MQMGSSFKSAVFSDDVADHLRDWADVTRRRKRRAAAADDVGCLGGAAAESSGEGIQLQDVREEPAELT